MAAEKALSFPSDIQTQFQGSTLAFQAALGNTIWLIVAAVVAMYIVLGVLYESFIHPITILSTLPSAAIGALLALFMVSRPLDMMQRAITRTASELDFTEAIRVDSNDEIGRTLNAFEVQLRRMSGLEDGIIDGLYRYSRPLNGGYYWCPPMKDGHMDLSAVRPA